MTEEQKQIDKENLSTAHIKNKSVSLKITEMENQKLETLARKKKMKKSTLVRELVKIGYEQMTKKEL